MDQIWSNIVKQQIWTNDTHNLKDGIRISSERVWIWGVTWSDNNGYLALFNSWYFKSLLSKSDQYENTVQGMHFAMEPRLECFEGVKNLIEGLKVCRKMLKQINTWIFTSMKFQKKGSTLRRNKVSSHGITLDEKYHISKLVEWTMQICHLYSCRSLVR